MYYTVDDGKKLENTLDSVDKTTEMEQEKKGARERSRCFTAIQIIACAIILLAALVLRLVGGAVWETSREWYNRYISDALVPELSELIDSESESSAG